MSKLFLSYPMSIQGDGSKQKYVNEWKNKSIRAPTNC